jgi:hypothetical protein
VPRKTRVTLELVLVLVRLDDSASTSLEKYPRTNDENVWQVEVGSVVLVRKNRWEVILGTVWLSHWSRNPRRGNRVRSFSLGSPDHVHRVLPDLSCPRRLSVRRLARPSQEVLDADSPTQPSRREIFTRSSMVFTMNTIRFVSIAFDLNV